MMQYDVTEQDELRAFEIIKKLEPIFTDNISYGEAIHCRMITLNRALDEDTYNYLKKVFEYKHIGGER